MPMQLYIDLGIWKERELRLVERVKWLHTETARGGHRPSSLQIKFACSRKPHRPRSECLAVKTEKASCIDCRRENVLTAPETINYPWLRTL